MTSILGRETITRRRFGTDGAFDASGLFVETTSTTDTDIKAAVQGIDAWELATLPKGERHTDVKIVITRADLRCLDERADPQVPADHVQIDGRWYEVRKVERLRKIMPHLECRVVLLDEEAA